MDQVSTGLLAHGPLGLALLAAFAAVRTLYGQLKEERAARDLERKESQAYIQTLSERFTDKLEKLHAKNAELATAANELLKAITSKKRERPQP